MAAFWALFTYRDKVRSDKAKNLSDIWRRFYSDKEFSEIFSLFDRIESNDVEAKKLLQEKPVAEKLRFAAYLAEVATLIGRSAVSDKQAYYLYQWHFKYVFGRSAGRFDFWNFAGNTESAINTELSQPYWAAYTELNNRINKKLDKVKKSYDLLLN